MASLRQHSHTTRTCQFKMYNSMVFCTFRIVQPSPQSNFQTLLSSPKETMYRQQSLTILHHIVDFFPINVQLDLHIVRFCFCGFNQPWMEISICGWVNPQIQNLKIWRADCTIPLYIRDMSILGFWGS